MMKRLKITVDGTVYDVTVEEVGNEAPRVAAAPATSVAAPAAAAAQASVPSAAKPGPAAVSQGSGAPGEVVSPLAGTVLRIEVAAGQAVSAGDPLLLLEAMKMESVIAAPVSGSVKEIKVAAGASVQEGQLLLVIG